MTGRPPSHHSATDGRWNIVPVLVLAILLMVTPLAVLSATPLPGPGFEIIRGQVFDERGIPTGGVLVRLDGTSISTPTDEYGLFSLPGPALDGDQTLVLSKDGYMTAMVEYSLEDGGTLKVSVYLVEEELVPGAVEGMVRSFTGDPIEGVLVMLQLENGSTRTALTDADGHFSIHEVPPSHVPYSLMVEAPGHTTLDVEVVVKPGLTTDKDVTMAPETPMELIRGRVLDGRGFPLSGVAVRIQGSIAEWTTDEGGRFSALLDGRLWTRNVSLTLRGYQNLLVPIGIPEPGLADVELEMSISDEGGPETLWVLVLNAWTDEPVKGATVSLGSTGREWTTDSHGTVMITGADLEGWVELTATKSSHTYATEAFLLEDGGTGVVTLLITRTSNAVIMEGVVLDSFYGLPVVDALVMVDSGGIERLTMTDLDGSFLVHNLPPGVMTVITVIAEGYHDEQVETILQEFEENRLTIGLEPEGPVITTVDGVVSVLEGPLEGARVTLWTMDGFMAVAHTDHIGGFSFQDVPVASGCVYYRVEYEQNYRTQQKAEIPADGSNVDLYILLEPFSKPFTLVQGLVRDPNGFPVDDALVEINADKMTRTVDGHYQFLIQLYDFSTVELSVTGEGYGHNTRSAIVTKYEDNWVNLTIPLGPEHGNVLGTVRADGDKPLEAAEVQLSLGGAYREVTATGPDGSFAFRLVPVSTSTYQLSVVAEGYNGVTVEASAAAGRTTWYNLVVNEDVTSVETIIGAVRSNEDLPVANAVVRIGSSWNMVTDANGTFVLVDEDLEGHWWVAASLLGFENTNEIVEVLSGATVWVDLTLDVMDAEATTVGGMVMRASNGKPLAGATVRLARSASSTWTFETTTDADGSFAFRGVPLAWDAVAVTVSFPEYHEDVARSLLSASEVTHFEFPMKKVVQPEPQEPVMTKNKARQVGAGVSITIGALAILLMTEVGRVALLGFILVPLYTKIKREKVMDHFVRGRIYEFVCQNPGVNYSAIKAQFKLTNGTVTYHLSMLERQEFIRAKQDGIYKRYFSNNGGPAASEVEPMSLQLTIAKAIRERPGMTQKEIAKRLGSSKQLVSYHIRRMKKDGELETHRDGRSVRVFPNYLTPE